MQKKTKIKTKSKTPVLSLRQVSFSYEERKVLRNVNCDFYESQIHVIVGPSGSGKSTLLQVINGLIPHVIEGEFEGEVSFRAEDVTDTSARMRSKDIGLVMQDPEGQFCTFTVEEEIAFGLENHAVSVEEIENRVNEALSITGMTEFRETALSELSGGQKQKVAIASIIAMNPAVLLLDEPTANLDPKSRREVLSMIAGLARKQGITIIMVEHNLADVFDDIDRITVMDSEGGIVCDADRDEALDIIASKLCDAIRGFLPRILWSDGDVCSVWTDEKMSKEPLIEIEDIHFSYPLNNGLFRKSYGPEILKGLSLTINRGDFMVIAGRNGVGKTTLVNLLFRTAEQQRGAIRLDGKDIRKYKTKDLYSRMGLVFQNPELQFVTNQVDEELLYSLKQMQDLSDDEKSQRVDSMLEQFHLSDYKSCSPYVLSQGQKRRLSVATMLLTGQEILFLDEPTYGQDYENKRELMVDMLELNSKGVTIVFITHDEDLIREYAQRVVYIEDGATALDGRPEKYFGRDEYA